MSTHLSALAHALFEQIAALPTVDAHEHLHPEAKRVARRVDIFLLFHQYLAAQLISAGMPAADVQALESENTPLEEKWAKLAPYLPFVRDNAVAWPAFEALRFYFGEEDLTADNYERLTERMRVHNRPGLYEKCLRHDCGLVAVLNQNRTMWQTDLFKPILFENRFIGGLRREDFQAVVAEAMNPERWAFEEDALAGAEGALLPDTLYGFIEIMEALLQRRTQEGMRGVKSIGFVQPAVNKKEAQTAYQYMRAGRASEKDMQLLLAYLRDQMWERCGRLGLVAVIHTGVWAGNYAEATTIRPTNVLPMALAHPHTRFDLFHAGTPWPADAGLVARATHNVWLNLCWSHLISPTLYEQALEMWLDYVPVNRIIGFGGDYWWNVENVYGALKQARQSLAQVLASRVAAKAFNEQRALWLAQRILHGNPAELYSL